MKEKLMERLNLMNQEIDKRTAVFQQANADLNMIQGARQELIFLINALDAEENETTVIIDDKGKVQACEIKESTVTLDHCVDANSE